MIPKSLQFSDLELFILKGLQAKVVELQILKELFKPLTVSQRTKTEKVWTVKTWSTDLADAVSCSKHR